MKPRLPVAGILLVVIAIFATACAAAANPEGWAAPVFEDSEALIFLEDDQLSAVSVEGNSGTVLWTFPDDNLTSEEDINLDSVYSEPIVDGDSIYIGSYEGDIYEIGRDDGRLRWSTGGQVDISGSIVSGPVLSDGRLVFGTTEGFLYVVDAEDGSPFDAWPADGLNFSSRGIWAEPVIEGDTAYVATMDGKLRAIDLVSGNELWNEPFSANSGAIAQMVSATDASLFVPTLGQEVFLVGKDTGSQEGQTFSADGWIWTTPAFEENIAYFGDFSGSLFAVDITTMAAVWEAETDGRVKAGPAIVGEWVIFADESPAVLFVNKETGQIRNRVAIEGAGEIRADVVARDGVAYVVTTEGRLFKADPSNFSVVEIPIVEAT